MKTFLLVICVSLVLALCSCSTNDSNQNSASNLPGLEFNQELSLIQKLMQFLVAAITMKHLLQHF